MWEIFGKSEKPGKNLGKSEIYGKIWEILGKSEKIGISSMTLEIEEWYVGKQKSDF